MPILRNMWESPSDAFERNRLEHDKRAEQIRDVLRRDFGVLTVSVQAKKGLVTKKDRQAFSSAL